MNKTVILVVAIIAAAAVVIVYVWSSNNRYYIMTSSKGVAYKVDRKTGKSWTLDGSEKVLHPEPVEEPEEQLLPPAEEPEEQLLPPAEKDKVKGEARFMEGSLYGYIYNGSSWIVTRVAFNVTSKGKNGSVAWNRDYSKTVHVRPLSSSAFNTESVRYLSKLDGEWTIKEVYGHPNRLPFCSASVPKWRLANCQQTRQPLRQGSVLPH
jgi:hypothetical protein